MPYMQFKGKDFLQKGLYLVSMSGSEGISELFHYKLILESDTDVEIKPTDIIGQDISLKLDTFDLGLESGDENRVIHGVVNCFQVLSTGLNTCTYQLDLVPSLWFLTKQSHFQIFENKKSTDIVNSILSDNGIQATMPAGKIQREHCIQYMESDYDFITRLLADEGFIFYFEHSDSEHKLIVKDSNQYMNAGTLDYLVHVQSWNSVYRYITDKWEAGDYSYSESASSLSKNKKTAISGLSNNINSKPSQVVTAAKVAGEGDAAMLQRQADILAGREDAEHQVFEVTSSFFGIYAGASFSIDSTDYLPEGAGKDYAVIETQHQLDANGYSNNFKCIPSDIPYFAKKSTARQIINAPMTALVVESGTDPLKLGRIKVKFLYEGSGSEEVNSCWIRVAQLFAGKEYGAMFTPRIDEEVVVSFINGNPDRPLITGSVYNATNKSPEEYVSESKDPTRHGFLTKSHELYFEDEPDKQLFFVRSNKDYERKVEANDTLSINKGERKITITEGDENSTLKKGNKTTTLDEGDKLVTLKKGSNKISLDDGDRDVTVKKGEIKVEASAKSITMKAGKDVDADAKSNIVLKAGSKIELKVGGNSMVMDMSGITLKVGGNSIKIEQAGITIKGIKVEVKGDAMAELKSPLTTVSGDGMLTVKGGVVMIN